MTRWVRAPHLTRDLADELLVAAVDPSLGAPIRLNSTAVAIWRCLEEPVSVEDVVDRLSLPVDRATAVADVQSLVHHLVAEGVVQEAGPTPPELADQTGAARPARGHAVMDDAPLWLHLATLDPDAPGRGRDLADFGEDTAATIEEIERMGSLGQLAHAIDGGHVLATEDERVLVQERWAACQMHCLRVEQMLLVALRRLEAAGVPHRLLKGVAVTHLDHPGPSWREFGDADVLVPEGSWDAAVAAIESDAMFRSLFGEVTHPFGAEKGMTFLTPDGLMLDLHKRLNIAGLGARPVELLFDDGESFELGGMTVWALSRSARLLHALLHWFSSKPIRRVTMRDLVELADADPDEVGAIARELQLTGVAKRAAELVGAELEEPALLALAARLEPTPVERILAARRGEQSLHRNVLWRELTGVMVTPGIRGRVRYVGRRLLPDEGFRDRRAVTWRTYAQVLTGRRVN